MFWLICLIFEILMLTNIISHHISVTDWVAQAFMKYCSVTVHVYFGKTKHRIEIEGIEPDEMRTEVTSFDVLFKWCLFWLFLTADLFSFRLKYLRLSCDMKRI